MTASKQGIAADLKRIKEGKAGRLIVCYEGEPIPPHNEKDHLVIFEAGARELL